MPEKSTRRSLLIGMIVLSAAIILGFIVYRFGPNSDIPFDAAKWHEPGAQRDRTRYRMLNDLVGNHLPIGMKKSDVIALLGEPDRPLSDEGFADWELFDHYGQYGEIDISIRFDAEHRILSVAIYNE